MITLPDSFVYFVDIDPETADYIFFKESCVLSCLRQTRLWREK